MDAKIVSFAHTKGGVGKSTLSILLANYIAYFMNRRTLIIDGDPQGTILSLRKDEEILTDEVTDSYRVDAALGNDIYQMTEIFKDEYDYIILDLAGTIMGETQFLNYSLIDKAIVPFNCSSAGNKSFNEIGQFFYKNIIPIKEEREGKIDVKIMFNDVSKNTTRYKDFSKLRNVEKSVVEKSIDEYKKTWILPPEYPLPFKLLNPEATINSAPSALTGMMSSLRGEKANDLINKYKKQLGVIYEFIQN